MKNPNARSRAKEREDVPPGAAAKESSDYVTVPVVLPATWRDDLRRLAALRAAQGQQAAGRTYSLSALFRDILAPLMPRFRDELRAGHIHSNSERTTKDHE
jgi:hypothetical protein